MGRAKKPLVSNQIVLYGLCYCVLEAEARVAFVGIGQGRRRYLLIPPPGKKCPVHNPSFSADG